MYRLDTDEASKYAAEDPFILLRNAVLKKAADDYLAAHPGGHAEERLRSFFCGRWCNLLMIDMEMTGTVLLRKLAKKKGNG